MKSRRKHQVNLAALTVSGVVTGVLLYVLTSEGLDKITGTITGTSYPGVIAFGSLSLLGILIRAFRYRLLLKIVSLKNNKLSSIPSYTALLTVTAIRGACVDLLPARLGEVSYFLALRRLGVRLSHVTSSFGIAFMCDLLAIVVLLLVLLPIGLLDPDLGRLFASPVKLALILIPILFFIILFIRLIPSAIKLITRVVERLFGRISKLERLTEELESDFISAFGARVFSQILLLTVVIRALKFSSLVVLLRAVVEPLGVDVGKLHLISTIGAFICAEAAASLPVAGLFGFGAYEGVWSTVLGLAGIDLPDPGHVAFAVHLITQLFGYSFGLLGLVVLATVYSKSQKSTK